MDTSLIELDHDSTTSLRLAVDANDPPRFYVMDHRQRLELIAIRDAGLARELFLKRVEQRQKLRHPRHSDRLDAEKLLARLPGRTRRYGGYLDPAGMTSQNGRVRSLNKRTRGLWPLTC